MEIHTDSTHKTVIHPTAIVNCGAELDRGVEVGPFCFIDAHVKIGAGTKIGPRVTLEGYTTLGRNNQIFTGAVIGSLTQDKKYKGGKTYLRIGDNNSIREYCTLNPGTLEGTETVIGNGNLLMAYAHIAHDCIVGDETVIANNGTLAGHCVVEDKAIIGGLSGVHQFVTIGKLSIVGGCSKVTSNVPPFMMVDGHPAKAYGLNGVGMERNHVPGEERSYLKKAFKIIFRSGLALKNAIHKIEESIPQTPAIVILLEFLKKSDHGICK
ncbi:MAG: acyl-ACP--UDP-N-acetylglucosamine O-acyltransferase [Candidatus Omnitrophica bacterium]|nr:acyl-ACP--UDP-N-acetylglucosamine O-acyltransferase [Candidatus Omnitrophota bacterium]